MKNCKMKFSSFIIILLFTIKLFGASFNSSGNNTVFLNSLSWILTSGTDSDGIPDIDDNITILDGDTIILNTNISVTGMNVGGRIDLNGFSMNSYGVFSLSSSGVITSSVTSPLSTLSLRKNGSSTIVVNGTFSNIALEIYFDTNITSGSIISSSSSFRSFVIRSTINNSGNLYISSGISQPNGGNATWNNLSGSYLSVNGNITVSNFNASASNNKVIFGSGANTVKVASPSYYRLELSGNKAISSTLTVIDSLIVNSGIITTNATLNFSGHVVFLSTANLASNNTSTIVMNGSSAQTITIPVATTVPFNNLTCSNSSGVLISGGNLNIKNNLSLTSGTLSLGNRALSIKGNISSSGTGNLASGAGETNSLTLDGTSAQTITNTTGSFLNINNLICNNYAGTITLSSGNLSVANNLTVSSGTLALGINTLTVNGALNNSGTISSLGTINIAGNLSFTGTGNLSSNNTSHIVMNGSSSQTISSSNSSNIPFSRLTCSNASGVSLSASSSGRFTLKDSLVVQTGNFNAGSDLLTLLSDASKTAIIGRSSGTISGNLYLQRYIPSGGFRKYDLGSTVTSATIDDWDDELFMSIGAPDNEPGYPGGDGSAGGKNTVFIYNNQSNASNKYEPIFTGTTLQVGRGYQILIADNLTTFPGRTIDLYGEPNMGTVSLPVFRTGSNGFNLVANPFQAHIDWSQVSKSNVSSTVYFLENNGTKFTYFNPRIDPNIPPGLGFMCVATGANPSVSITQSAKVASNSSNIGFRLNPISEEISDLKLRISSLQNAEYNEADLFFDKKAISGFDFEKDFLFGESLIEEAPVITFIDAGKLFVRNYFNDENETVYFPLSITTPIAGNYSIDLEGLYESNAYQDAYLINNLTKEKYSLTNNNSASIYFDKVENEQFQLVLSKKSNVEDVFNSTSNLISVFATSNNLVIKNSANQMQQFDLKVYNVLGQMLFEQSNTVSGKSEVNIPTEFLKSDIYIVKLKTVEGNEITKKVVLTK
jgi:hypothetical protein